MFRAKNTPALNARCKQHKKKKKVPLLKLPYFTMNEVSFMGFTALSLQKCLKKCLQFVIRFYNIGIFCYLKYLIKYAEYIFRYIF